MIPPWQKVLCGAREAAVAMRAVDASAGGGVLALDVAAAGPYIGLSELAKSSATVRAAAAARNQQGR
jgi:predicted RNA methylase